MTRASLPHHYHHHRHHHRDHPGKELERRGDLVPLPTSPGCPERYFTSWGGREMGKRFETTEVADRCI